MRALYDSKSKLDDRGIKYLLSEENKYKTWLKVEGALALSQAKEGFIPKEAAEEIASVPFETLDLEEMEKIKAKVGHGFVPFVKVLVKACKGEGKKYVHYGVTTQNIQQTSQLYITRQVTEIYKSFLADILKNLQPWQGIMQMQLCPEGPMENMPFLLPMDTRCLYGSVNCLQALKGWKKQKKGSLRL